MAFAVGTRIKLRTSVWPERVGCEGVVVAPPTDGTYPQPGRTETLILLDVDPLGARHFATARGWSCVELAKNLEAL